MDKFLKIALVLGAVDKASSVISNAVAKSSREMEKLGRSARMQQSMDEWGDKALIAGTAIVGALSTTVTAAEESEVANRRLQNVFKSMGDTTGQAAIKAAEYASALSMQIGVEDESILAAQAKIATFKHVSDETARMSGIFDRATQAAFDLAAAGFGEAGQNAVQLGKALEDPIKGITALSRSGVTFSAVEKEKIKQLVKSGQLLEAQKIVLKAVETQVGGTAKATATESSKMRVAFGEVSESVGKILLPMVNRFNEWLTNVVPKIQSFVENNEGLIKVLGAGGVALLAFGVAMKVAAGVMAIFNAIALANPVVLIIAAIAAAATLIFVYWDKIKAFFVALWASIKKLFSDTWNWIKNMFLNYTPYGLIFKHWDKITAWFSSLWDKTKKLFSDTWNWIKNMFLNYTPYGLVIKHWDKIVAMFTGIWDKVKAVFQSWVDWVMNLGTMFYEAGKNIVNSIWKGIKEMANKPIEAIEDMTKKMREYLPFSPAKRGPLMDIHRVKIMETIAQSVRPAALNDKMRSALQTVRNTIDASINTGGVGGLSPVAASSGGASVTYSPVVNIYGGGAQAEQNFRQILQQHKDEIVRIMNNENARKQRTSF